MVVSRPSKAKVGVQVPLLALVPWDNGSPPGFEPGSFGSTPSGTVRRGVTW